MEEWVKVGSAPNETSGFMIQGILENVGIPVVLGRPPGVEVPTEALLSGHSPQDVMVPQERAKEARQLLEDTIGMG